MKILIASDHAGFEMKESLSAFLKEKKYEVEDLGPFSFDETDDYPDFINPLAKEISENGGVGIIIGGSGQGEAIAANRFTNVRAIVYNTNNSEIIKFGREHNDANILSIGARFVSIEDAKTATVSFLTTPFSDDERHKRRISKLQ
ncbi:MAG: RpiB/LacA/LacB family sugar-phosphate isomerase [Candidatus Campbellbacteria bacterium]|nr:RpiB/LacA/LacB family sugar-phosphate isomerase [Candidatus Campbellbacteria bacterium]